MFMYILEIIGLSIAVVIFLPVLGFIAVFAMIGLAWLLIAPLLLLDAIIRAVKSFGQYIRRRTRALLRLPPLENSRHTSTRPS